MPEDQLETIFQPFQRGEISRNRATGGAGLGLGIARAIAKAHGATLRLENRPEGGLVAIVRFPADLLTLDRDRIGRKRGRAGPAWGRSEGHTPRVKPF